MEEKRIHLTEKFLDAEFDKLGEKPLPLQPTLDPVATAIMD